MAASMCPAGPGWASRCARRTSNATEFGVRTRTNCGPDPDARGAPDDRPARPHCSNDLAGRAARHVRDKREQRVRVVGLADVTIETGELREDPVRALDPRGHRDEPRARLTEKPVH